MKMKNMETTLEKMDKCILNSLAFLDNKTVYVSIIFILFLYNSCLFSNINKFVSNLYDHAVVKVLVLLLIIYVSRKSCLIGILLTLSFVISLSYNSIMENFVSGYNSHENSFGEVDNNDNQFNESFVDRNHHDMLHKEKIEHRHQDRVDHRHERNNNLMNSEMEEHKNIHSEESKESFSNNLFMNEMRVNNETNDESVKSDCLNNYMPKYEGLSNLCDTVSTFKDSLDAQGLNHLNGYEKQEGYLIK